MSLCAYVAGNMVCSHKKIQSIRFEQRKIIVKERSPAWISRNILGEKNWCEKCGKEFEDVKIDLAEVGDGTLRIALFYEENGKKSKILLDALSHRCVAVERIPENWREIYKCKQTK